MKNYTRKEFLQTSLIVGGAALVAGRSRLAAATAPGSANGDVRVAVVGINAQGAGHMRAYLGKLPGARLVAICDVDSEVLRKRAAECELAGFKPTLYRDYRKLLENKDIDAVVLGTPNHQHSLQTIWALQAGKDVYCEKPLSHNVWEGRQVVAAVRKYHKNIVQAGTQNRSSEDVMDAIAFVRSGKIGRIQWARALCYKQRDSIGRTNGPQAVPKSVDYDLWTGPADLIPPHRNSPTNGPIHYDWHWFWNYGGGDITNQGIHQMDVARWFLGEPGLPPTVMSFGGRFGYRDDAETPNTLISVLGYEKAPLIASGGATVYDNAKKKIEQFTKNTLGQHRANFIAAVRNRKVIYGLAEECHYSSALCHLANVSYLVGAEKSNAALSEAIRANVATKDSLDRMLEHLKANQIDADSTQTVVGPLLKIDPKTERFFGSEKTIVDAANRSPLLKREGRGDFKIPVMS